MWSKLFSFFGGKIIPSAAEYFTKREERKAKLQELEHLRELAKLEGKIAWEQALTKRAYESEGRDHEWELESIRNSGWKDELVLIILSLGMVGSFVPGLQPYVIAGFDALAQTPDWYRWLIVMIYAATFGIRVWRRKL